MIVSIIIPNYNGEKYLRICLDSLSMQSFKEFETIVVDNNSNDNSCNLIKLNYPYVKLIKLQNNYGFSYAVNQGIKKANGDYLVLLNNDTEVYKEWLENLLNCIKYNNNIFSCCSRMIQYNNKSRIDDVGDEYNILGWAYKRGDNESISKYNKDDQVFSSCAGAAIYKKEIFEEIGYFDECFFAYMEDVDISFRARIYGYKNYYCSNALVYHVGSGTSGSKYNEFKVKLAARNNLYVIYKNMPLLMILINMPFLILGFMIKILFFLNKNFGKQYILGLKEGITTLNKIQKVPFKFKNLINYIKIEFYMIFNTLKYIYIKIRIKLRSNLWMLLL